MSAFNASINVTSLTATANDETGHITVALEVSQVLPIRPQGADAQPLQVPIGLFTFAIDKANAVKIGKQLQEEAQNLPDPSNLTIASDLREADVIQKVDSTLKGS